MRLSKKIGIEVTLLGACLLLGASMPAGIPAPQDQPPPAADNTKTNKDKTSPTADQQKMNPADRELTKKIRASINSDKTLSTYAHNVKIISQDGKVTLRTVECLGGCGWATIVAVDERYRMNVKPDDVPVIVKELRGGE